MGESNSGVQSLERAFGLLELLSESPQGVHLLELAERSGLHKSTVHRLLGSLLALGYVAKDEAAAGKYRLSFKLIELSGRMLENLDALEMARGALDRLRDRVEESVHLVVRESTDIVYVHKAESRARSYHLFSRIGMRRPMYCTAAGKAILASLDAAETEEIWRRSEIMPHTARTITTLARLNRELERVRAQGYALDDEENEEGVRCMGAAVRDYTGGVCAAFSVSMPAVRMPDERIPLLAEEVCAVAASLSEAMGYRDRSATAGSSRVGDDPA